MRSDPAPSPASFVRRAAKRGGWHTALRAWLLFLGLLLVMYLLGAVSMLVLAPPSGAALSDATAWTDALSYPLTFAGAQTPPWTNVTLGIGLVAGFVVCFLLARRLEPPVGMPVLVAVAVGQDSALVDETEDMPIEDMPIERQVEPYSAPAKTISPATPAPPAVLPRLSRNDAYASAPPPATAAAVAEPIPSGSPVAQFSDVAPAAKTSTPRVFVSHSSADNQFGHTLVERLRAVGIDAWYDSSGGLVGGDIWWDRIVAELSEREVFVVLLSPEAMRSDWVRDEIRLAWQQKNGATGKVIVPVLYSACDVPPYVAMVQTARFDTLSYEEALSRLIEAIRDGKTRTLEPETQPSLRLGAPFDETLLPPPSRFIGRQEDLAWVEKRLAEGGATGITAVRGVGGIGKTALAAVAIRELRWAGRFRDGIAVVICANMRDPRAVLRAVLLRFDSQRQIPDDVDLATLGNLARELLRGKDALVVLDNVEPELDVAAVVTPLREAGTTLLLTARHILPRDVVPAGGSQMLELLSPEDALDLFAEYYRHGTALDLTRGERAAAERIVDALGRHTLAVKLAAATALDTSRDLDDFASSLGDPQHALDLTESEAPRAVRETFDSSYRTLPEDAQRVFAALAAFATGDMGRNAVEVVAEALDVQSPGTTVDLLVRRALADGAVIDALPEGTDRQRLRLHPLLRAFAQERFSHLPNDQRDETQLAVAAYYARYANATPDAGLLRDEANIEGAIERAHERGADDLLAELCMGMRNFWIERGRARAGLLYLPWGMEAAERVAIESNEPEFRSRAAALELYYAQTLYLYAGRVEEAKELLLHVRDVWHALGDRQGEVVSLGCLGEIGLKQGQLEQAQRYLEEGLMIAREIDDRRSDWGLLNNLGSVAHGLGQLEQAQRYLEESLVIAREIGDRRSEGITMNNLGTLAQQRGDLEAAQRYFEQSLAIRRDVGDRLGEGATLSNLGGVAQIRGDLEAAERYYEQALAIAGETQYAELAEAARENLAAVVAARRAAEKDSGGA